MATDETISGAKLDPNPSKIPLKIGLKPVIGASLAIMAAGAFAVYWFWFILVHWYTTSGSQIYPTSKEAVLSNLGIGLLPIALWLSAFLVAIAFRPSSFRRYQAWLASAALLAVVMGTLGESAVQYVSAPTRSGRLHDVTS